ncbi:MAG: NF038104 family lipoprotein [Kingella oralis]
MLPKPIFRLPLLMTVCYALQGCVVASAVDLAATAVVQTGKIAVKGTSAAVRAMIPDGDDDDKKAAKKEQKQREQAAREQAQQPPESDFRLPETIQRPMQQPMQPEND